MKKLAIIQLTILILFVNMVHLKAEDIDSIDEYIICCKDNVHREDVEQLLINNKDLIIVEEIVYEASNTTGTYSIGIVFDDGYDTRRVEDDFWRHFESTNDFIQNEYGYEHTFISEQFTTNRIIIKTNLRKETVEGILSNICQKTAKKGEVEQDVSHISNDNVKQVNERSLSYNSCYHYYVGTAPYYHNGSVYPATNTQCVVSAANLHGGDGNSRLLCGYKWMPTYTNVAFYTNVSSGKNRTHLTFKYATGYANLGNIQKDSNETLEMEVQHINHPSDTNVNNRGTPFQLSSGKSYSTNIPSSYLDVSFGDSDAVQLCVGCNNTNQLSYNTSYYWIIDSNAGTQSNHYNHDGRFRVVAQRGYHNSEIPSGWNVYPEAHEGDVRLGISSSNYWVVIPYTAWYYAANNTTWSYFEGNVYTHMNP